MPHQSKRLLVSETLLVVLLTVAFAGAAQAQVVSTPPPTRNPTASPSPTPCPTPDKADVINVGEFPVARIEAIVLSRNRNRTISATIKEAKIIRRYGSEEPAAVNAELYKGDAVETSNESFMSILFSVERDDANQVILYPNARITIGTAWNWWGPILNRVRGYFRSGTNQGTGSSHGTEYLLTVCDRNHRSFSCQDKHPANRDEKLGLTVMDDSIDVLTYDISIASPYRDPSGNRFFTIKRRQANLFARMLQIFRKPPRGSSYEISRPDNMLWLHFSPPVITLKKGQSAKVLPIIDTKKDDDLQPGSYSGDVEIVCSETDSECKLGAIFSASKKTTLPVVVTVRGTEIVDKGKELSVTKGGGKTEVRSIEKPEARKLIEETSEIILSLQSPELVKRVMPNYSGAAERQRAFKVARIAALVDNRTDAYEPLGNVNVDWGRGEKAVSAFEKTTDSKLPQMNSPLFHSNLAEAYRLVSDLEEAQKEITSALELDQATKRHLGRFSNTQGNIYLDEANTTISDYEYYESISTQYPCYAAQVLSTARDHLSKAKNAYLTASSASVLQLESKPENRAIPLTNLGDVYLLESELLMKAKAPQETISSETDKALSAYAEAVNANPDYPYALSGQGEAYLRKARFAMLQGNQADSNKFSDYARQSFSKAISINSNLKTAFVGRSIANQYLGDVEAAKKDIRSVITLNPNAVPRVEVPDVVKKPKFVAVRLMMDAGLFPVLIGTGDTVIDQDPPGSRETVSVGSEVKLQLGKP